MFLLDGLTKKLIFFFTYELSSSIINNGLNAHKCEDTSKKEKKS